MSFSERKRRRRFRKSARRTTSQISIDALESRCLLAGIPELIQLDTEGDAYPEEFVQVGDTVYFSAEKEGFGRELWATDGTAAGTRQVRDINPGESGSTPNNLTALNGKVIFSADDGTHGRELWMSDGTEAGTVLVKDINLGNGYSGYNDSSPANLVRVNDKIYFSADDDFHGRELWMSDGTEAGTLLLKDISPGVFENGYYGTSTPYTSAPSSLTAVDGKLFFSANDNQNGKELWMSDGTTNGTVIVRDIFAGEGYQYPYGEGPLQSFPNQLTNVDGKLFFTAVDQNGEELWMSDGTEAGTVLVEDLFPGTFTDEYGTYPYSSYPRSLTNVNGTLFFTASGPDVGEELFRVDAGSSDAVLVRDIVPGDASGVFQSRLVSLDDQLVFTADNGEGLELWRSDGTASGTQMIRDLDGSNSSDPRYLYAFNGQVYFSAITEEDGREPYVSDGTEAGTVQIVDIWSGPNDSQPTQFFGFNDQVLFSADDGSTGFHLYTVSAKQTTIASLIVYVDGSPVEIPANIGIANDGTQLSQITTSSDGRLAISAIGDEVVQPQTLGDFFETWQTMAGVAGNNPEATFSSSELFENATDGDNSIQMFVNGAISQDYDQHTIQNGDAIVLIYGEDPVVSLQTNFGPLLIELFESETPGTVENFLKYVNDGEYDDSFFHRSVSNFVIQGGGFITDSVEFTDTSQFLSVATDPPIANEPGISNQRGTIAMAKLGGNPDSATSQFFVNLGDNSALDLAENNSFTVFGKVLEMSVVDRIANLPIDRNNLPPFSELPVSASGELAVIQDVDGLGAISGIKFEDLNLNGFYDEGESGLEGISIFLDANNDGELNSDEISTTTDSEGRYYLEAPTGDYVLRSEITTGQIQTFPITSSGYSINLEIGRHLEDVNFGEADLPAPTSIDLVSDSDTGVDSEDNITRLNNDSPETALEFRITGIANGAVVRLFASNVMVGSTVAASSEVTLTTDGSTVFPNGMQDFHATQEFRGVTSQATDALSITIDSLAPGNITSTLPNYAQVGQAYDVDIDSPNEGQAGIEYSLLNGPAGMTIDATDGQLVWTPTNEQARPQSINIRIADVAGNEVTESFDISVLGVLPAYPDSYTVEEDSTLNVAVNAGLFSNDGDSNDGTNTSNWVASLVDSPQNGSVSINPDGSFSYQPNADFSGIDSFTYTAAAEGDTANTAAVTIDVSQVNDAPVGTTDSYTLDEDQVISTTAANGVLANDSDADADTLIATLVDDVSDGTLSLNDDGSFTYLPRDNFNGSDSFSYRVSDGISDVDEAIVVDLNINAVADDPIAQADSYQINEDTPVTIGVGNGVLSNDSDADGDVLTASLTSPPENGSLTLQADGSFSYSPNANYFGQDRFSYEVTDGNTRVTETATIQVIPVGDPPTANDDQFILESRGEAESLDVLVNDTSAPDSPELLIIAAVTQASAGGQVSILDDQIRYIAPPGFIGSETFTYTLRDEDGLTAEAMVTVETRESSENSLAGSVFLDLDGDGKQDSDESGVPGTLITLVGTSNSVDSIVQTAITDDAGRYRFESLPSGTYQVTQNQPTALLDGAEQFDFPGATISNDVVTDILLAGGQAVDGLNFGESSIKSENLSINWFFASSARKNIFREVIANAEENAGNATLAQSIRDAMTELPDDSNLLPVAIADHYDTRPDETLSVNADDGLLANDIDADGDSLTVTLASDTTNGSLTLNDDGSFVYVPDAGFEGTDRFNYTVSDGQDQSAPTTVTVQVEQRSNEFDLEEDRPAGTIVGTVESSAELSESVIFEFVDVDRPSELNMAADDHLSGNREAPLVLIEYIDYQCPVCRTFNPIVADLEDSFSEELLVVTRHLPVSEIHPNAFDAALVAEAAGRQGAFDAMSDLLLENQDEWANLADATSVFSGYAATLDLDLNQFNLDFVDPALRDRVNRDLEAANTLGLNATPAFFLHGNRLEDLPDDLEDFRDTIQEELDDFDDTFVLNRVTGDLILTGTSPPNFENRSVLNVPIRASDTTGQTEQLDVIVNVLDVNEPPLAFTDNYEASSGLLLTVESENSVLADDSDVDGDSLTATLVSDVSNGQLTLLDNGTFFYTSDDGFTGTDSFIYQANDGSLDSNPATVNINVTAAEGESDEDVLSAGLETMIDSALADEEDWLFA